MTLRRTTMWVEEEDLAVLKVTAARSGRSEAELIRSAIHLEALRHRQWDEPFFEMVHSARSGESATEALAGAGDEKAADYLRTR